MEKTPGDTARERAARAVAKVTKQSIDYILKDYGSLESAFDVNTTARDLCQTADAVIESLMGDPGHDATYGVVAVGEDRGLVLRDWNAILTNIRNGA